MDPRATSRGLAMVALAAIGLASLGGCRTAYYNTLEKFGYEKRELLTSRLGEARESQIKAEAAYVDALAEFRKVVRFDGGDLSKVYDDLNDEYEDAKERADDFGDRVDAVDNVATALFREWDKELGSYDDAGLRRRSEQNLNETRNRYARVHDALRDAESSFQPALGALHDKVLFLKHNLNAQAIGAIRTELPEMEAEADRLRRDVERSNAEAERFLRDYGT